ncbi:hypothetical protein [Rhizohabitans arisaemae]|uniref:hypothetical protein n=1 Tax=Rhizohabitans arisaemae TaxID=2720610 RepID=UPI0024B19CA7|nr:hypothetical protein [Rhizohabitans arisaemae]
MNSAEPARTRRTPWLIQRWPTALAVAMSALTFGGSEVAPLSEVLLLLPLLYLVVAKLRRRQASWPVLVAGTTLFMVLRVLDVIAPSAVFAGAALIVLIWGAMGGQLHRPGVFRIQALGMLGFGALALAGLIVDPALGRYLVAAGWLLHGVWDFIHLKLDKVVARSYAEWCGVLDILIAVELVLML